MGEWIEVPGSGMVRLATDADLPVPVTIPARPPMRALTAAAAKLQGRDSETYRRMSEPWQLRALSYYDVIGEIRFASQFYAKLLSKVRYYPARQLPDDRKEPITDGAPVEILHKIQDPGGGRSRLQYDYGRMMFVTGEGVLFGDRLDSEEERWRFLWKDEVRRRDDGMYERVRYDKQPFSPPQVGQAYRLWTPHPRHSDMPDSPLHSVMDIAEELIILTAAVRATAVSRMTNGVFILPSELSPNQYGVPDDDDYIGDEDPETSVLMSDYIEHATAQIENPGTAEAALGFTLEGAYEYVDRIRWMATHDPQTDYMEKELRTEAVRRLALGLDFPPEFLLGMTDANHWTARQVVYDMWRSYGTPVAERFADDLADVYLRPALREEGYADWQNVVIDYDDSRVVIPPDRTEDADKALDRIAISFEGYRKMKGIDEDMAPSEDEKEFLASLKLRQPIELEDGNLVIPQRGPVAQMNGNDPEDGPPSPNGGRVVSRQEARTASVLGAAKMALLRCREVAGARLRRHQQGCEECQEATDQKPNAVVASVLGVEQVARLGVRDPMALVQGGADGFYALLCAEGYDSTQAASLKQMIEVYAGKTIFDPRQPELPAGFVAAVEKGLEVTDAIGAV